MVTVTLFFIFDVYTNLTMKKLLFTLALIVSFSSFGQTIEELYKQGRNKLVNLDYYGAIADYTRIIKLSPVEKGAEAAYYNRGLSKMNLNDTKGAISDYTRVIEINPNNVNALYNRGHLKNDSKDYYGSLSDYTRLIEINPNDAEAYFNRGVSKYYLNDNVSACQDARKAQELGYDASRLITKTCY